MNGFGLEFLLIITGVVVSIVSGGAYALIRFWMIETAADKAAVRLEPVVKEIKEGIAELHAQQSEHANDMASLGSDVRERLAVGAQTFDQHHREITRQWDEIKRVEAKIDIQGRGDL